jgi:membrane protein
MKQALSHPAAHERVPLWAPILTFALVALGFSPRRYSIPDRARRGASGPVGNGTEPGRGRSATTPSDIPARGWKDILLRVYENIGRHHIIAIAAGITFYALLAIFPAIAALVSLYGLFADPAAISSHLDQVSGVLPGGAIDVIRDQMTRVASQGSSTLGVTFVVSLAVSLWSANAGIKSVFEALNIVYAEDEKRGLVRLNAVSLAFTTAGIAFVLIAIGSIVGVPMALQYVGLESITKVLVNVVRWPVLLAVVVLALAAIYRYGPSRDTAQWRWITWGSAFAGITWLIASGLFSWYAANFGTFNKTYGSLGAVIGFMMWIWISAIVVLLGAELDAEMEHQTARDTTEGPPQPLGTRGAKMADTLGPRQ